MRIGTGLTMGFGLVVAALLVVVVGSTLPAKRSRDELTAVLSATGAKESLAAEMKAIALLQSSVMRNVGLRSDIRSMQAVARFRIADDVATPALAVAPPREARDHYRPSLAAERRPAAIRREPALPAAEGEEWKQI